MFSFAVSSGGRQVNQVEVVVDAKQGFGVPEKEISMGQEIVIEVLDDPALGSGIEVDQDVATEDNVDPLHESHAAVVQKVQPLDRHPRARLGSDRKFAVFFHEVLFANLWGNVANGIFAVHASLGMRDRSFVQVGGLNIETPALEQTLRFLQQNECERVGFFAGGTAGAPNPEPAQRQLGFGFDDLGQNNLAQDVQLRFIAEEVRFPHRGFVQQRHEFSLVVGFYGETVLIVAQAREPKFFHPPPTPVFQKPQLVIWMEDARHLVNQITDA